MLKVRIIPCLDIKNGQVVKGINFKDLSYAGDPVEVAIEYNKQEADELCFLDISASSEGRETMFDIVNQVAQKCFIPLTAGGGVRSLDNIKNLLRAGADKVAINSAAVKNPDLIKEAARKFGSQAIVVAVDVKRNNQGGFEIYTYGGSRATGIDALKWIIKMENYGAGEILLTSMDKDGTKTGFDNGLNSSVAKITNIPIIASGGVGKLEDFVDGVKLGKAQALLAASIFHYKETSISKVKQFLKKNNINIRENIQGIL